MDILFWQVSHDGLSGIKDYNPRNLNDSQWSGYHKVLQINFIDNAFIDRLTSLKLINLLN